MSPKTRPCICPDQSNVALFVCPKYAARPARTLSIAAGALSFANDSSCRQLERDRKIALPLNTNPLEENIRMNARTTSGLALAAAAAVLFA
jgi:hypothetical protein